ncbi:ABC transporter permease [Paenibacillus contaminans]|uniref:Sugar ABC transporter permease n=1 Tax=Paenibacillus contaminans TaxID=450362 RepID=A0A329MST9_9BACL|nr:ABC transporter permease subunit [Paenibacillus contaminans]RAV22610.1 sugar ABC transporter permease [Paenibacillus contaminans]
MAKTEFTAPPLLWMHKLWRNMREHYQLYMLIAPALIYYVIFHYIPMYGIQIAFKDFVPSMGIWGSEWVGFEHIKQFFDSYQFWNVIKNTLGISLYGLVVSFPIPILLALMLNEVRHKKFKAFVQTLTYAPHFISMVVMVGMMFILFSPSTGVFNQIIVSLGGSPVYFMGSAGLFKTVYVLSGVWQGMGWGSIIYLAALSAVDPHLYEAAYMDGASKLKKIIHIDLPAIVPTAVILLILNVGSIMSVGFEKVFLMQNPLNLSTSEVISTYVYKIGLLQNNYSYGAAIGVFNSVINFILLISVNTIAKRTSGSSLW